MGFEVYLQFVGETKRTGLSRSGVRSLFPVDESQSTTDYWKVRYDETNTCAIGVRSLAENQERIGRLYVERPCGDLRLWNSLFTILGMGQVVLFFPGGPMLVANACDAAALPMDITESLGKPVCVDSGESIRRIIEAS